MAHQAPRTNPFEPDEHPEHGVGHVVQPRVLIATAIALLFLTVVTVAVAMVDFAQFDLSELNIFIALAVAAVKASLVCLFFMHLRWDRAFNSFVLVGSIAFVALFIAFAMMDTGQYQREVKPGESDTIKAKLAELQSQPAPPPVDQAH